MSSIPPPSTSPPSTTTPGPTPSTTTTTTPPSNPPPPPPTSTTTPPPTSITTTSDGSSTTTPIIITPSTTLTPTTSSTTITPSTTTSALVTSATGGGVTTIFSVITATSSRNVAPTGSLGASTGGSKGFFHNTGAVAGVFTVVGLIVLAIFIALVTNCIRRRRAKKFDDEIAAAARDAANTQVPNFAYDDDDEYRPGGYGGGGAAGVGGAKFSDASHGTYAQPPMSISEGYGMRELPRQALGPNPGEYYDSSGAYPTGAAAGASGAAGIGVARARSMRDGGYAAGLTEGSSPYAAFVAPVGRGTGPQYPPGMIRGAGSPEFDLNRRPSQPIQQQQQQQQQPPTDYAALARNKSQTTNTSSAPSYQSDQQFYTNGNNNGGYGQQGGYPNSYGAYATGSPPGAAAGPAASGKNLQPIPSSRSEENLDDAYGGYVVDAPPLAQNGGSPPGHLPNPFSGNPGSRPAEYADESDDEVEEPRRVLKVANE